MPLSLDLMKPGSLCHSCCLRWLDQFCRSFHCELMNMRAITVEYVKYLENLFNTRPQRQRRRAAMPITKLRNSAIVLT